MKTAIILSAVGIALAACTPAPPPPLCDREAVQWDKWGTTLVPAECEAPSPIARPTLVPATNDNDRRNPTLQPEDPRDPVKPDEPVRPDPRPDAPDEPDEPNEPQRGNPGNHKPVGNAGENPGKGGHETGGGDRGMSDNPNKGNNRD